MVCLEKGGQRAGCGGGCKAGLDLAGLGWAGLGWAGLSWAVQL